MSRRKEIDSKFISDINKLISNGDKQEVKQIISNLHIADTAEIINEIDIKDARYLFELIEKEDAALLLIEIEEDIRKHLLDNLSSQQIAQEIIEYLETDDATDIISGLERKKQENVLSLINDHDYASNIENLLSYPENTAGSLMATELIKVNENWSTLMCLKEMRKQATEVKKVHTIYVVNNENILLGSLSLRRLLITETKIPIKEIANTEIISVKTVEDNETIANTMNKYDLVVLPVVNEKGELLGRITIDDVMDVVKEEAEKDYQMASGIVEDVELSDSIWQLTRARLPWLLIGLIGGILGAFIIDNFLPFDKNFQLTFFIPLIAAMGGNVGVQSAAIVVQGLANKSIINNTIINKLMKELSVALLNGVICSTIIFIATFTIGYDNELCLIVSLSLISVIIFASLFGTFVPLALDKYKIDPALATGPFITTVNDVLGLFIYLMIGNAIL